MRWGGLTDFRRSAYRGRVAAADRGRPAAAECSRAEAAECGRGLAVTAAAWTTAVRATVRVEAEDGRRDVGGAEP